MERVIRLQRLDDSSTPFVLLLIRSRGPGELDLDIAGSEGENPFAFTLRQDDINSLRDKKYKGEDDEWQALLAWALCRRQPLAKHASFVKNVEFAAIFANDSQIVLTLAQNVQNIKRRLGTLTIPRDDDQEIELYDWAAIAARSSDEAEQSSQELRDTLRSRDKEVSRLQTQLDDFVKIKKEHEDEILEKFRQLLNSKKLKIRDQQRLLAGAKIDFKSALQVKGTRLGTEKGKKRAQTRASKRKADEDEVVKEESHEESVQSSADEDMDDAEDKRTPEADSVTEEDEDVFESAARPAGPVSQKKPPEDSSGESRTQQRDPTDEMPPERELPYTGPKKTQDAPMQENKVAEEEGYDDDDDTDDEL